MALIVSLIAGLLRGNAIAAEVSQAIFHDVPVADPTGAVAGISRGIAVQMQAG